MMPVQLLRPPRDSLESLACGLSLPLSKQLQAPKGSQQEGFFHLTKS
jgi:hypothetical protein